MFPTKKGKAQEWSEWFSKVKAKRQEIDDAGSLAEAREQVSRATHALQFTTEKVSQGLPVPFLDSLPSPLYDQSEAISSYLNKALISGAAASRGKLKQYSALFDDIRKASEKLKAARAHESAIHAKVDQLKGELAELEAEAPKASDATLIAMAKEVEGIRAEYTRIEQAISNLDSDNGTLEKAQKEAALAAERLEEAEALAALGEASDEDVKAANVACSKARTQADKQTAELRRVEAARRGLERKLEEVGEQLAEIDTAYKQAAIKVHGAALANAEAKLVAYLSEEGIRGLLAEMAKHHAALTDAQPGNIYGPANIEVRFPALYYHPDHEGLSTEKREISPAGVTLIGEE